MSLNDNGHTIKGTFTHGKDEILMSHLLGRKKRGLIALSKMRRVAGGMEGQQAFLVPKQPMWSLWLLSLS